MSIAKNLAELINAEVIDQETADRIKDYYAKKGAPSTSRLVIVFGILGAILVGLGIILIIAHNWDDLSRPTKTGISFFPLIVGQLLCGYTLLRKQDSAAWKESTTAFLYFAVGASISLISQVYNIQGDLSSFMLTWILLTAPLIYVMKSSIASLLHLVGITYYACEIGYWSYPTAESYTYWLLLLLALPHYYHLYRKMPESNFITFHHWLIPLSVVITLGTVANSTDILMFSAYFNLFGLFYLIGISDFFELQKPRNNGFKILGSLGTIVLLLTLSFNWFWEELSKSGLTIREVISAPEFYVSVFLFIAAAALLYRHYKQASLSALKPSSIVFILFAFTFVLGYFLPVGVLLINLLVFAIGVLTIREGARKDNLGMLNYGLLIVTALIICRFFDTNFSFVIRGIMFVLVGSGFFAGNYWMLKKRKTDE